jgi:hypothetical protein
MCRGNMSYIAHRIFRVLEWYRITRVPGQSTGLRSFDDAEEMIVQDAIRWAGSYYRTASQGRHAITTPPRDHNVPRPTRILPQPPHTTDGRPGSSDDISQQSCTSYLQSIQLRLQAGQLGIDESNDGRPGSPDDNSPQSCASRSSTSYDWSDYPQGFRTEDGDLVGNFYRRLQPRLAIPSTTAAPQQVNVSLPKVP